MIRFDCPECRKSIKAPPQQAGERARCPKCKSKLTIPTEGQCSPSSKDSIDNNRGIEQSAPVERPKVIAVAGSVARSEVPEELRQTGSQVTCFETKKRRSLVPILIVVLALSAAGLIAVVVLPTITDSGVNDSSNSFTPSLSDAEQVLRKVLDSYTFDDNQERFSKQNSGVVHWYTPIYKLQSYELGASRITHKYDDLVEYEFVVVPSHESESGTAIKHRTVAILEWHKEPLNQNLILESHQNGDGPFHWKVNCTFPSVN